MKSKLLTIYRAFDQLKYKKRNLLWILAIDAALAIASIIVDWPWLVRVPTHLVIFAPICSLYPLLLFIWFALFYFQKKIPAWFTVFVFMGTVSYGLMAQIYFPFYMSWNGINFHDVGSMVWVALYGLQSLIIASEIKKLPLYQYALIFGYFFFKDYSDRYLGTFLDVLLESYPENLKLIFTVSIAILHILTTFLIRYLSALPRVQARDSDHFDETQHRHSAQST